MKRIRRFTIRRLALGLAVVAVLAPAAQAKPTPSDQFYGEIPYLSQGHLTGAVDDRPYSKATSVGQVEIPYLSHGVLTPQGGVDDRAVSRATTLDTTPVAQVDDGYELNFGIVGGVAAAMMLALGAALLIRHSRRTKLSPA
jgi:hypothetical protein